MYYLSDTCTTRCSIKTLDRRSHLRIVSIGWRITREQSIARRSNGLKLPLIFLFREKLENQAAKSAPNRACSLGRGTFAPFYTVTPSMVHCYSIRDEILLQTNIVRTRDTNSTRYKPYES